LMLLTFLCQGPRSLRATAALASCAFIAYGVLADLPPVLVLHSLLLGVNLHRLWQLRIRRVGADASSQSPKSALSVGTHLIPTEWRATAGSATTIVGIQNVARAGDANRQLTRHCPYDRRH
jgi:hypothetical protein